MDSPYCFSFNGFRRRGHSHSSKNSCPSPGFPEAICGRFSLAEMKRATQGFHPDQVVGEGGFGRVYKGCLDDDRTTLVAIKRWNPDSMQGRSEFLKEVELYCQLRHQNLLPFKGFCKDQDEMILVHEYMPNGSLDHHLFDKASETLPWSRRLQICIDAARGLHYLHCGVKQTIIHRDVKTSNILLGQNWEARLSDLGLSKVSKALRRVNSRLMGTRGYAEPEYLETGELTEKTDVYSFGVVLFEVLSGRQVLEKNLQGSNLMEWVSECQQNGTMDQIVDPCVKGQIAPQCLRRFVDIAEMCALRKRKDRPSMGEVQVGLEDALELQQTAHSLSV